MYTSSSSRYRIVLLLLFAFSLLFNVIFIQTHPFLHLWDEQFHALVAKHLAENPFLPLLYKNPPFSSANPSWVDGTIWLHKQPLFLWQMALSIKVFGVSEFAVRFPSALMLSLVVFPLYRIGVIMFNRLTGILAALLTVSNWFILEHIDGFMGMDHNDVAFMFYVTLSLWALMEYIQKCKLKYALLIGLFSGCAMLNKWVVGLVVYEGIIVYLVFAHPSVRLRITGHTALALLVTFVVFIPWQFYTYVAFRDVAIAEWMYNQRHFWEILEGHEKEQFYYLNLLNNQFGLLFTLIFIGILLALFKRETRKFIMPVLVIIVSVFVFYSLASTKVGSYTMVLMPFLFVFIAFACSQVLVFLNAVYFKLELIYAPIAIVLVYINFNYAQLESDYRFHGSEWFHEAYKNKAYNTAQLKHIAQIKLPENTVIIGLDNFSYIDGMFYTDCLCYGFNLPIAKIQLLKEKRYRIAVFRNHIPPSLINDMDILILDYDYH